MPINILMPALSPTMEEGALAKWLVKEGDRVASGTLIAEIETDKATMEFEAVDDGILGKIVVPEGTEGVKVNDLIAVLLEEGETIDDLAAEKSPSPKRGSEAAHGTSEAASTSQPPIGASDTAPSATRNGKRSFASPLARRIATERGVDLSSIAGSGPNGRIVKADIERAVAEPAQAAAKRALEEASSTGTAAAGEPGAEALRKIFGERDHDELPLDGMRRTIASRLVEAKRTIPHFYLRREIRLDALIDLRTQINAGLLARNIKLSINDFVIKATAIALQQVPDCNAVWAGDRIMRFRASDVAVAVAVEGGLYTPVLRDADSKSLSLISEEMKDLAARARARKLAPSEYQGGTTAISNLGMMGVESFDAVINPPHASILAVGAGIKKPVIGDTGDLETATVMSVTLSVDHRVIDGALGAQYLAALTRNLEAPVAMLA